MTFKEVCKCTGIPPGTLQNWLNREGVALSVVPIGSGNRNFSPEDALSIAFAWELVQLGILIGAAAKVKLPGVAVKRAFQGGKVNVYLGMAGGQISLLPYAPFRGTFITVDLGLLAHKFTALAA